MSKVTRDDILKLAQLSRLELTEDEIRQFSGELTEILGYVEQLQQVDIEGVEPAKQVTGLKNVMRKDEAKSYGPTPKDLMRNAPAVEKDHFKVKRMID